MQKQYFKTVFLLIFLIAFQTMESQAFKTPNAYLDFIGDENQKITKSMWQYTKSLAHSKSPRAIEGNRKRLVKSVERAMIKIKKAKSYQDDQTYKNEVLEFLDLYKNLLNHDYAKIVDMKEVAEQSYDLMEAYILAQELADKRMQEAQENYANSQKEFAARNNVKLIDVETELGKKMKVSNEVFKHKNEVYLIFFKSNMQEGLLMEAISNNDISAIQQNANALQTFAKEGITKLDKIALYKEDHSLVEETKKALGFYIEESEKVIPSMLEFFLLNEKFETIKNTLEKKPARKRTKKEINEYNAMVKKINKAVKSFNKMNNELNKKRSSMINSWNASSAKFLSTHIPKE